MALGRGSTTVPSTSITSSLATLQVFPVGVSPWADARDNAPPIRGADSIGAGQRVCHGTVPRERFRGRSPGVHTRFSSVLTIPGTLARMRIGRGIAVIILAVLALYVVPLAAVAQTSPEPSATGDPSATPIPSPDPTETPTPTPTDDPTPSPTTDPSPTGDPSPSRSPDGHPQRHPLGRSQSMLKARIDTDHH